MTQVKLMCPFGHKSSRGQQICPMCGAQLIADRRTAERYWQGGYDNVYLDRHPTI
jgi:hypothetical protein